MSDCVIKAENLSKQYRIGQREGYKTFRETLVDAATAPFARLSGALSKEQRAKSDSDSTLYDLRSTQSSPGDDLIWALKDVSFEVKQGEVVGIIGRNGAGKSTLLKILSRITEPTEGRVELRGRVGSLLEVGTGFHPELTGHENIYLYGAILGMDRWEITRKFDEIVAFAELDKFIDTPVKRYSSGMYMRLAFSVAAHLEPEILLVDEVLAVGDAAFQKKCLGKMGDVSKQGRTIIFVSHSMASVASLCKTAILLEEGRPKSSGPSQDIVERYLASFSNIPDSTGLMNATNRRGTGEVRIVKAAVLNQDGHPCSSFRYGDDICIEYSLQPISGSPPLISVVWIRTATGTPVLHLTNMDDPASGPFDVPSMVTIRCKIKDCRLYPGNYLVSLWIAPNHHHDTDFVIDALQFRMEQGQLLQRGFDMNWRLGIYHTDSQWDIIANG
jgi:lipopolysaccharide transport system ATP-binding protein